jgi:hypothetical protein
LQAGARAEWPLGDSRLLDRRRRFTPSSGPDARYKCIATRYQKPSHLISYFGGRFLVNVLSAPMTTSIAVSNDRLRRPALLVSTCSAHTDAVVAPCQRRVLEPRRIAKAVDLLHRRNASDQRLQGAGQSRGQSVERLVRKPGHEIDSGLTLAAALLRRTSTAVGSGGRKRPFDHWEIRAGQSERA